MITRNASKTALLTDENTGGQRRVIAHDPPDPTRSREALHANTPAALTDLTSCMPSCHAAWRASCSFLSMMWLD
jgi:hypothetical protein